MSKDNKKKSIDRLWKGNSPEETRYWWTLALVFAVIWSLGPYLLGLNLNVLGYGLWTVVSYILAHFIAKYFSKRGKNE